MKNNLACIILAAGKGTRMKSALPKVMHAVAGQPMIRHVVQAAEALIPDQIVVVLAPGMENVAKAIAPHRAAIQQQQLGTGDAVRSAQAALNSFSGDVLVLYGDVPLIDPDSLQRMTARRAQADNPAIVVLGFNAKDPFGYGRLVVAGKDRLERIVEQKDATEAEQKINLCWSGMMLFDGRKLWNWLTKIGNSNAQNEFYLTEIIRIATEESENCAVVQTDEDNVMGVNSRVELAEAEKIFQARRRRDMMAGGVTLIDPDTVYFSADTKIAEDVVVHPNVVFGAGVTIESHVEILPFSHIEGATIQSGARIGPFARLRPGTKAGRNVRVGNFVEIKNADLKDGAKINHLSYVGDASVGAASNIGAGTITCNYDGVNKYKTIIGDNVFVGSDSILVAPLTIADNVFVAAGSVITKDVPSGALALGRAKQSVIEGWVQKFKDRKKV